MYVPKKQWAGALVGMGLWLMAAIIPATAHGAGPSLELTSQGDARVLPKNFFGMNAPTALYEELVEDPAKLAPVKEQLAPALLRFPGGTVGNYYNWRTGQMEVPVFKDSSVYTRRMSQTGKRIAARLRPEGMSLDRFHEFSQKVGAEVVLVPNLETSSVEEQVAWFKHLKEEGIVPRWIELGNEFWVAMLMDPNVVKKFPDVQTTMKHIKRYLDALKPYLPVDAKVAVQSAGSHLRNTQSAGNANALMERMIAWDRDMLDEPWFDALTVRVYTEMNSILGPGASAGLPGNIDKVFPAVMAHLDEGLAHMFSSIEEKFPGKEIWVSEWSVTGVQFFFTGFQPGLKGHMIHETIRTHFSFLRCPSVTLSTMHMLSFSGGPWAVFNTAKDGNGFVPAGPATAMRWFNEAANGGATYRRIHVEGAKRITGAGASADWGFNDVEAALLTKGDHATLLVQNASGETKSLQLSQLMEGKAPSTIETFDTPDLMKDYSDGSPKVRSVKASTGIDVAPYSLSRIVWE